MGMGNFRGKGWPIVKYRDLPFGMPSCVDPMSHVFDGGADASMGRGTFRGVYGPLQSIEFRVG